MQARAVGLGTRLRGVTCASALAMLSACAGHVAGPQVAAPLPLTATQEAALYKAHAKPRYAPPGPPDDPWGPYITEASGRFDVPPVWIREVMHVESGGYQFRATGELTTSPVGAMGLMQLMPETYDEMRARYGLGSDAFEPHDNILAGTAYLREMYDAFGSPGFLAAYNAGPARLSDYLTHNRPLPDETRRYVWMIGSRIGGVYPNARSPAEQLAVNQIPIDIPRGPRYVRHTYTAVAARGRRRHEAAVMVAALSRRVSPHQSATPQPVEVAEAPLPRHAVASASHGLHFIDSANASEAVHIGGRNWGVQIGAYGNAQQAQAAAGAARSAIGHTSALVAPVRAGHGTLYRARLGGLTHDAALQACQRLAHHGGNCMIVAPASQ